MKAQLPDNERGEDKSARRRGEHGYDPALQSMHALGAARGPDVRACRGVRAPAIGQVDMYALLAHLLDVRTETGNAGDLSLVRNFLNLSQFGPGPVPRPRLIHDYSRDAEDREEGTTASRERGYGAAGVGGGVEDVILSYSDSDSDFEYSAGVQRQPQPETRSGGPRIIASDQRALLLGSADADSCGATTLAPTFTVELVGSILIASYVLFVLSPV